MCNWTSADGTRHIDSHNRTKGSAAQRRARKHFLLSPEGGFGGNGESVPCWECGVRVTFQTMIVDRIVPGCRGGRYTRDNIRPQCRSCSQRQSDVLWHQYGYRTDARHSA